MSALQDLLAKQRAQEAVPATPESRPEVTSDPDEGAAESGLSAGAGASDSSADSAKELVPPAAAEADGEGGTSQPYGVAQVVTPAGFEIYYQAGPKRLYRLRESHPPTLDTGPWHDVPSMSNVLDILDSPLAWWGMQTGVAGVTELVEQGHVAVSGNRFYRVGVEQDTEDLVKLLQEFKLTTNDTVKIAQDRGTSVHGALEYWAENGTDPEPSVYPESERGYVQGLKAFLYDAKAVAVVSEVMVGSMEWGYAGRFDLVADIPEGAHVFVHRTEKGRGDLCEEIPAGRWLLDLKTSKYVYKKHHLQLAGYRMAYDEAYGEQVDHMGVIHVLPDGRYQLKQSESTDDDFQNLKVLYDVLQRTQGR